MFRKISLITAILIFLAGPASATTIMKLDLGGTGPDFSSNGTTFGTVDDGFVGTTGNQNTSIDFVGDLASFTDILNLASFTLAGVMANGTPVDAGGVTVQPTTGGTFSVYDNGNNLLLSGQLGSGTITGAGTVGSFFSTGAVSFTGGSLASQFIPNSGAISIALDNIIGNIVSTTSQTQTITIPGVTASSSTCASAGTSNTSANACAIGGASTGGLTFTQVVNTLVSGTFTANGSVLISANTTAIPEPSSAALLLTGVLVAALRRKRA